MPNLILPSRRIVQPLDFPRIDWSNPLTRGLNFVFDGRSGENLVSRSKFVMADSASIAERSYPNGRFLSFNGSQGIGTSYIPASARSFVSSGRFSIATGFLTNSTAAAALIEQWGATDATRSWISEFDTKYIAGTFTLPVAARIYSGGNVSTSKVNNFIQTSENGAVKIYQDGIPQALTSIWVTGGAPASPQNITTQLNFGSSLGEGKKLNGAICWCFGFSRVISDSEAKTLSDNPWQIFAPQKRTVYFDVGAAGNAYTLGGSPTAFTLNGQSAGLLSDRLLTSDTTSFALNGQSSGLLSDKLLTSGVGAFTLDGQAVTLTYTPAANAYVLTAGATSYVFQGQDAAIITGKLLTSDTAAFGLIGQDVILVADRVITADQVAFTLQGQPALLLANKIVPASSASFALNGQSATLVYTPAGAYILTASSTAYATSGQDALLLFDRVISGSAGAFIVNGLDAGLLRGMSIPADTAAYLASGQDATLVYTQGYTLVCGAASYTLSLQDAQTLADRTLASDATGFTITGQMANLTTGVAVAVATADNPWKICIKGMDHAIRIEATNHRVTIN